MKPLYTQHSTLPLDYIKKKFYIKKFEYGNQHQGAWANLFEGITAGICSEVHRCLDGATLQHHRRSHPFRGVHYAFWDYRLINRLISLQNNKRRITCLNPYQGNSLSWKWKNQIFLCLKWKSRISKDVDEIHGFQENPPFPGTGMLL